MFCYLLNVNEKSIYQVIKAPDAEEKGYPNDLAFRDKELILASVQYSNRRRWRVQQTKTGHVLSALNRNGKYVEDHYVGLYVGARLFRDANSSLDWQAAPVGVDDEALAQPIRLWCSEKRYCLIQMRNSKYWLCTDPNNPILVTFCDQPQHDFAIAIHQLKYRPPPPPPSAEEEEQHSKKTRRSRFRRFVFGK